MSKNKFDVATEKALASLNNKTPKKATKKQLEKQGLEALAELKDQVLQVQEPVVVAIDSIEDPTEAAIVWLFNNPEFAKAQRIADLRNKAQETTNQADELVKFIKKIQGEIVHCESIIDPLQKDLKKEETTEWNKIMLDPKITEKRGLATQLEFNFNKLIKQAVQIAMDKKPEIVTLQSRITRLTAEANELKSKKAETEAKEKTLREQAAKFSAEATELVASVK
jgi:hypothetical protein